MSSALATLRRRLASTEHSCVIEKGLVTFINPYSYSCIRQHDHLLPLFSQIGVDGISMVWLFQLFLGIKTKRISFDMTSLAPLIFKKIASEEKTVALVGSTCEEIKTAQSRLLDAFPNLHIVATRSGYFDSETDKNACIQNIMELNPDVVVAGMGTPLQEQFLVDLWQAGWRGAGFTCGGFFHQVAKKLDYYPAWVNRLHLRWAYRIWDEPRLLRRYGIDYPRAAALFANDAARFRFQNS